ncbi:hypothetical protein HID58_039312 [Brassica napus]|uniref:Uncharacterized protein n=1 Tax=Brassica napus TaxID=3708 RepID=A0ABQ8BRQ0_BRANA|nr:hypothetical protein HID58_039312 [Brassica napus]
MSTAAKTTKSRDKKVVNDSQKTPSKAASGSIGGAYNPLLGTFQTVESTGSSPLHSNGRFKNIDESDSNCDSASNNGSWSGDSEDHKEKAVPTTATTAKQEFIPGADNDKREKMRLKNERKHQPASLGLFSGYGSTPSSGLEWNTDGSAAKSDYNNIDWSLDRGLACPRPQYAEASPYETNMNGRTRMMGNGNGMSMAMGAQEAALVGNGREWTSPFEGKDLFSLSRQYVPPSL